MNVDALLDALPINYYLIDLKQQKIVQTNDSKVNRGDEAGLSQLLEEDKPYGEVEEGIWLCRQLIKQFILNENSSAYVLESGEGKLKKFFKANVNKVGEDRILVTYSDITRETISAKELKINNRRLQRAEKLAALGAWEIDITKNTMLLTKGAREIYGVQKQLFSLKEIKKILLPEHIETLDKEFEDLISGKKPHNVRFKIKRQNDGEIRQIDSIAEYREDKNMVFGVLSDITEKIASESALNESLNDLKLAQNIANIGNWKYNPENKDLYCSEQVVQIIGENKTSAVPGLRYFEKFAGKAQFADFKSDVQRAVRNGKPFIKQFKINVPEEAEKWIEIICRPDKEKRLSGYFLRGTIQDITVSKKMEEELKAAKLKAEESDHLKSLFLANMSHEIRTPLNGILGFSNIICAGTADTEQLNYYGEIIDNCGKRLTSVIDDIIDISLIQANQLKLDYSRLDINELLTELFVFYRSKKAKQAGKLEFKVSYCENPGHAILYSDKKRLYQVLKNLLDNAFKFTKEGFIEFGCSASKEDELILFVKDSGIGIEEDKTKVIFDTFRQAEEGFSRQYEGTGLGLAIASGIVEWLGGRVWVKSKPGQGSAFFVSVPGKGAEIRTKKPEFIPKEQKDKKPASRRVVSFEDDPASIEYLKSVLALMEYEHVNFVHPLEGISYLRNNKADLVLMDVRLPEMSGFEATRIIKSEFPNLPVVIQTAYAMQGDKEKAFQAGCDDYLAKPASMKELKEKINQFVAVEN